MKPSKRFKSFETFVKNLQDKVCEQVEFLESEPGYGQTIAQVKTNPRFREDKWFRPEGGGGRTRTLEGKVFEKGAVNVSSVIGPITPGMKKAVEMKGKEFAACGCSLILHPNNPKIPTTHANVRYFELDTGACWYGGGVDLTPYYPYPDDFAFFHKVLKAACDNQIPYCYNVYKTWCDEYFTIQHRNEMRGVGGVFFDYLDGEDDRHNRLTRAVGRAFLKAYMPIVLRRSTESYTDSDKKFQAIRRGRYIEFNLVYDRGTLFGLRSNARAESILCSMPPNAEFIYDYSPPPDSPHAQMMKYYKPTKYC